MPRGEKTSEEIRLKFAEEFLACGCISQAARRAEVPYSTAHTWACELEDNPEFLRRRKKIQEHALDRAMQVVMQSIDFLADRMENAQEVLTGKDGNMTVVDKSPEYTRSIATLADTLIKRAKLEHDTNPERPQNGPVEITIRSAAPVEVVEQEG